MGIQLDLFHFIKHTYTTSTCPRLFETVSNFECQLVFEVGVFKTVSFLWFDYDHLIIYYLLKPIWNTNRISRFFDTLEFRKRSIYLVSCWPSVSWCSIFLAASKSDDRCWCSSQKRSEVQHDGGHVRNEWVFKKPLSLRWITVISKSRKPVTFIPWWACSTVSNWSGSIVSMENCLNSSCTSFAAFTRLRWIQFKLAALNQLWLIDIVVS